MGAAKLRERNGENNNGPLQMASTNEIFQELLSKPPPSPRPIDYNYLVPNMRGLENMQKLLERFQPTSTSKNATSKEQVVEKAPITSSQNPNEMPSREPSSSPSPSPSPTPNETETAPITSTADPNAMSSTSPTHSPSPSLSLSISLFASATESFSRANTNTSISSSLSTCRALTTTAQSLGPTPLRVRGYVSVALGCPYDGPDSVPPQRVASITSSLLSMGCSEVSIADTTGMGTPRKTLSLLQALSAAGIDPARGAPIAMHFHDTYGQALVNTVVALEQGVRVFDSSVGGLGGCPYSKGATGNVSTEDLVYLLGGLGMETGVGLEEVAEVGEWISGVLGRRNEGRAGKAVLARLRG
ncbi:MAG: hypothetical protein Q9160_007094 [Pyrenula sp. 1 TL-2023]